MEQLTLIIEQRRKSIADISSNNHERHKFQLIEEERKRNQRENWILRVLKSLKVLSIEQKRIIYETTHRMMTYYQNMPQAPPPVFETVNFLELIINLFVQFFNRFESLDFTHLKAIIRPNNNFIVVDLLKTLVEMGRKQFKSAMQDRFKDQLHVKSEKKMSVRSLVRLPAINTKPDEVKADEPQKNKLSVQTKLKYALQEKYGRVVQNINFQQCYERANELYFDLLYANQRNSNKIHKYLESCFGPKRHINYDASGLYTQEEIRKLQQNQKDRITMRALEVGELRGQCSGQHLREYFKMRLELHEISVSLPSFSKQGRLQQWFPFCLVKNGDKLHPFNLVVEINGSYFTIDEFQQRYGKRIRVYMKELLSQMRGQDYDPKILTDPEYLRFPRKDFISYHFAKTLEIIHEEPPLPKETLLPVLQEEVLPKRKIKSEAKISNKSLMMPPVKPAQLLERELERRLNYSSIIKDGLASNRRIESLIDHYVRTRELTK